MIALYRCSQKDFYAGLRILWNNYAGEIALFNNFKGKYREQYGLDAKIAIDAAESLPDYSAHVGDAETIRVTLLAKADLVICDFLSTERYIDELYENEDVRDAQYKIAGWDYYKEAGNDNWKSLVELGTKNLNYVSLHANALKMGGENMPDAFPGNVELHLNEFKVTFEKYEKARQMGTKTEAKIKANNACMKTARAMMDDAQIIFRRDEEKLKQFTWDSIMHLINPKVAGMKGSVLEKDTNLPLANVQIIMQKAKGVAFVVLTDENGKYSATGIASGRYKYKIVLEGKETIEGEIKINKGNVTRRNFVMTVENGQWTVDNGQ